MTRPRRARALWWSTFGVVALITPCVLLAGRPLVVRHSLDAPDVIVSLASHEWERLPEAASLAARHPSASVVLTLPQYVSVKNCHDCSGRVGRLVAAGVRRDRIHVVPLTQGGTYGEAVAARQFLESAGGARVLVVTSPYHTRRALNAFRTVFAGSRATVGVFPALSHVSVHPDTWWWYGYDRWYVLYEWAALAYYTIRYGVTIW